MPRPRRAIPTGQMSLFSGPVDGKQQNGRWIIATITTVEELLQATQREPDEAYGVHTETQRALNETHCKALAAYYRDPRGWIIAPFVFTGDQDVINTHDGKFHDRTESLNILDGQHRIQALHIASAEMGAANTENSRNELANLKAAHVTLMFIENRGVRDIGQLFADLNRGRTVNATELAYLDTRDPIVNVVKQALSSVKWADERTETAKPRPAKDGTEIWSITSLKTVLKALEVGVRKTFPNARKEHLNTDDGRDESAGHMAEFLQWLTTARPEYENLEDQPQLDVADERTRHYAYEHSFIALLAQTWTQSRQAGPDLTALAATIQQLNINRNDPANHLNGELNLLKDNGAFKPLRDKAYDEASIYIRQSNPRATT